MNPRTTAELTERERLIAEHAARIVADELKGRESEIAKAAAQVVIDDFHKSVGRSIINKWVIVIGAIGVGFMQGKGYIANMLK